MYCTPTVHSKYGVERSIIHTYSPFRSFRLDKSLVVVVAFSWDMKPKIADHPPSSGSGSLTNKTRGTLKRRPSSDNIPVTALQANVSSASSIDFNFSSSDRLLFNTNNDNNSTNSSDCSSVASDHDERKDHRGTMARLLQGFSSIRLVVLLVLCLQNSFFTVLRRYSQGVLKEKYSKYECLLVGEIIKLVFSAYMIGKYDLEKNVGSVVNTNSGKNNNNNNATTTMTTTSPSASRLDRRLWYLVKTARKMVVLALIYGVMNILSFVALRNIGAGVFTVIAQCKILTTATFSKILLQRQYSATKWRALIALVFGVLLFSEPIWYVMSSIHFNMTTIPVVHAQTFYS